MAKVVAPLLSEEAHGALGGIEFRTGHYGNMVGRRSIAARIRTPLALEARSRMKLAQEAWDVHDPGEIAAWDTFARHPETGRNRHTGGHLKANGNAILYPHSPYEPFTPDAFTNVNLTPFLGPPDQLQITWDTDFSNVSFGIAYQYATWHTDANPQPSRWRYVGIVDSSGGGQNFTFTIRMPVYWVRIDWMNHLSLSMYRQTLFRFVP